MIASTSPTQTSIKTAALISGFCLLIMVIAAPVAEMYAYPKLIVRGSIAETINNLSMQKSLFTTCILAYLLTFILDIVVSWSLYLLLKPVNADVSLLAALFRVVYTVVAIAALLNLVSVYRIVYSSTAFSLEPENIRLQVAQYLNAFKSSSEVALS